MIKDKQDKLAQALDAHAARHPWQNTNILELEKELKWRQLQNEKRKEIVLNAAVAVLKKLRLTKMGT